MNAIVKLALSLSLPVLAASAIGCTGGGVEGAYALDKSETKKMMEAEVAKLPEAQQGFAKLAVAMVEGMDVKLDLKSGGQLEMTSSIPSLTGKGDPKTEKKTGQWAKTGDAVVLKLDKELSCQASGKKLTCNSQKKGDPALVFNRS